jgi:Xaa-Pro aminopeptidase
MYMIPTTIFITNPTNIRYLSGFVAVDTRDAYFLVLGEDKILFTSSLYTQEAKKLITENISFQEITRDNPLSKQLRDIVKKQNIKTIEFESTDLTVAELTQLEKNLPGVTWIPITQPIELARMIKKDDEIKSIREAAYVTDLCFKYILSRIRPGITETKLAWEIESFLKFRGGDIAFTPIVAFNEHSAQPHYMKRDNNPLRRGSLILLDFGAKVNGYCADMTRVVFLGSPKPEWKKAYEVVLEAQQKALDYLALHSGSVKLGGDEADGLAQEVITKSGLPVYPHSLGHAVGLDIHEAPRLTSKKSEELKSGMVVTIEPGVYIEDKYGIRIEDLVLLKDKGIEILSKSPKKITVL